MRTMLMASVLLALGAPVVPSDTGARERHFEFSYQATIAGLPAGQPVSVWLPYPSSDAWQWVRLVRVEAPARLTLHREPEYGNQMLHLHLPRAPERFTLSLTYNVARREQRAAEQRIQPLENLDPGLHMRLLRADALVPIDGLIAEHAQTATQGAAGDPIRRARAVYDYVTRKMRYDKSGTGWGQGDALYACNAWAGNCTDFHSLLIGMSRALALPARFEIGFPLPPDQRAGDIGGYHCWASLYLPEVGWWPVDSSEASKAPDKHDYFFGTLDEHRVLFSIGRDLRLAPPQAGARVNYFIYPYVEAGGRLHTGVETRFAFREMEQGL